MRPLIFISHVHEHRNVATAIEREISRLLLNGVDFFVSSDRSSLVGGDMWLQQIENAIDRAAIVLVICSRDSVLRPWVNFEAGGAWMAKKRVLPLCCGGLRPSDLPQPLASRHAYRIDDPENLQDLIALIAREAGLNPPEFSAADLAALLQNAMFAPVVDPGGDAGQSRLPVYPETIRLLLKLAGRDFFDDVYEHDARDNARRHIDEEIKDIRSQLRAFLVMKFGPKQVAQNYQMVKFPAGWISTWREEDLRTSGYESSTWCEVAIEVATDALALLHEVRSHQALRYATSRLVGFVYRATLDLNELIEDLCNRKVQIKRLAEDALTVDRIDDISAEVTVVSGKTTVEIRLEQYDFREIDVSQILAPVFRHLKIDDHLKPLGDH